MGVFRRNLTPPSANELARFCGNRDYKAHWLLSDLASAGCTMGVPHLLHVLKRASRDTLAKVYEDVL